MGVPPPHPPPHPPLQRPLMLADSAVWSPVTCQDTTVIRIHRDRKLVWAYCLLDREPSSMVMEYGLSVLTWKRGPFLYPMFQHVCTCWLPPPVVACYTPPPPRVRPNPQGQMWPPVNPPQTWMSNTRNNTPLLAFIGTPSTNLTATWLPWQWNKSLYWYRLATSRQNSEMWRWVVGGTLAADLEPRLWSPDVSM